jgi:hypothetical protein
MQCIDSIRRHGSFAVGLLVAMTCAAMAVAAEPPLADFSEVETIVSAHLNHRRGYQPGDLLSQADWDAIQTKLTQSGWTPRDAAAIRKLLLPAKDFLVLEARSSDGAKFMRQVSRYPGGYDRLDRLARMPYGVNTVRSLIRGPDGYKMFEYMVTTPGGSELGRMLAQDPGGKNFNELTGRIYNATQLIDRLERSHTADFERPKAKVR